ncbi:MAG: hypothetical protein CL914_02975 [Deltaproteobacteria bacterium]|jgi:hypothetical protein|nr:hypothetical protein [Deltaproteobacteria bacterium]
MIDDMELNSDDELFLKELETVFISFIESSKEQLDLEPMNSYKRRLAHKLSGQFQLESESIGEDKNRAVLLKKTPQTKISGNRKFKAPRIDTGNETYYAKPGVQIVLRSDGSFGVPWKEKDGHSIDKRVVHDGVFRIRSNQIVCQEDSNW